ncbi:MAG: FkbM family methyltransferase [Bacteroidales bacterium]|nr:FkbM family methyltransferase [Bacteroidales bacterium]
MIIKLPWDRNEKDFIRFLRLINVEKSGDVLDIGANIGVMTYHFAKKFKNSTVHSFEPMPINYRNLKRIVKRFKLVNVKNYSYALGNEEGSIQMIMPENKKVYFHGLSHVVNKNNEKGLLVNADIKRLDDIEELSDFKIKAIKIDVEDFEYLVLKGGEKLINKNRPLIYAELWDSKNKVQSFNLLTGLDYKCYINNKNHLEEYTTQQGFQNYFFIPAESCDDLKL